jgi:hypothetical protein
LHPSGTNIFTRFPRSPSESCWEVWNIGAQYKNIFAISESLQALKKSAAKKLAANNMFF